MLRKSKLLDIDERGRILLVRNRKSKQYNFPGGRGIKGESYIRTLRRELRQELPEVRMSRVRRWRKAPAFKRKSTAFYFGRASGPLKAGHEIDRAARIRRWWKVRLSRSTRATLKVLAARGCLAQRPS